MKKKCPYCVDGRAWEVNYMYWTDPNDRPKTVDELICERTCSYCMNKDNGFIVEETK